MPLSNCSYADARVPATSRDYAYLYGRNRIELALRP